MYGVAYKMSTIIITMTIIIDISKPPSSVSRIQVAAPKIIRLDRRFDTPGALG
jgi:hypothetical protein